MQQLHLFYDPSESIEIREQEGQLPATEKTFKPVKLKPGEIVLENGVLWKCQEKESIEHQFEISSRFLVSRYLFDESDTNSTLRKVYHALCMAHAGPPENRSKWRDAAGWQVEIYAQKAKEEWRRARLGRVHELLEKFDAESPFWAIHDFKKELVEWKRWPQERAPLRSNGSVVPEWARPNLELA